VTLTFVEPGVCVGNESVITVYRLFEGSEGQCLPILTTGRLYNAGLSKLTNHVLASVSQV
jgi:hypothetical protein